MSPFDPRSPKAPLAFLQGRSLLSTADFTPGELNSFLDTAIRKKAEGARAFGSPLAGKSVAMVFFNPSLRTRVSMTVAITQLGGTSVPVEIGAGTWDLEHREGVVMNGSKVEHVKEAVPVLCQYVDLIAVRCFPGLKDYGEDVAEPVLSAFAKYATVPVLNLESATAHPCQALADMMTIKEQLGSIKRKKLLLTWANHPKALPHAVPRSFALAAAQCGADLWIAAPDGYGLGSEFTDDITRIAASTGGSVHLTDDRAAAYDGAEIVYAKSWSSFEHYGDAASDLARRAALSDWMVDESWMTKTNDAKFMHCLPVRRNVVVADEILDGPRSIVVPQAANRLHAQKAWLAGAVGGMIG